MFVCYLCSLNAASERFPCHRLTVELQQSAKLFEQRAQPAGVIKILHQVFARWSQVGNHRRTLRDLVKLFQIELEPRATSKRNKMDDCISRPANGHVGCDRIFK